jgi:hypothetical protein
VYPVRRTAAQEVRLGRTVLGSGIRAVPPASMVGTASVVLGAPEAQDVPVAKVLPATTAAPLSVITALPQRRAAP